MGNDSGIYITVKPEYNFKRLTNKQQWLILFEGWRIGDRQQPTKRTVKKLIDRGLVILHKTKYRGLIVDEYEVPGAVYLAYLQWCAGKRAK